MKHIMCVSVYWQNVDPSRKLKFKNLLFFISQKITTPCGYLLGYLCRIFCTCLIVYKNRPHHDWFYGSSFPLVAILYKGLFVLWLKFHVPINFTLIEHPFLRLRYLKTIPVVGEIWFMLLGNCVHVHVSCTKSV